MPFLRRSTHVLTRDEETREREKDSTGEAPCDGRGLRGPLIYRQTSRSMLMLLRVRVRCLDGVAERVRACSSRVPTGKSVRSADKMGLREVRRSITSALPAGRAAEAHLNARVAVLGVEAHDFVKGVLSRRCRRGRGRGALGRVLLRGRLRRGGRNRVGLRRDVRQYQVDEETRPRRDEPGPTGDRDARSGA